MDFEKRLQKAIERGRRLGDLRAQEELRRRMTEEELRRLHGQYRITLNEHIEQCLRNLAGQLPGFQLEPLVSDRGWGAAVGRDDFIRTSSGSRENRFSRLEIFVTPWTPAAILELKAKAIVQDKELFYRSYGQPLAEVDMESFLQRVDQWVLEFAEAYAARPRQ
ncbi:MAG TPA: hypothetical protein PLQ00_09335 [Thermoguttaceae bacterium]|nr:hypothetical protein [Thermoguttaceae bacterium]